MNPVKFYYCQFLWSYCLVLSTLKAEKDILQCIKVSCWINTHSHTHGAHVLLPYDKSYANLHISSKHNRHVITWRKSLKGFVYGTNTTVEWISTQYSQKFILAEILILKGYIFWKRSSTYEKLIKYFSVDTHDRKNEWKN